MTPAAVTGPKAGDRALVCIRPGGARPPIYCVHAQSGHLRLYHSLADHLEPGHPVYGVRAVRPEESPGSVYSTLEEMADRYANEILAFQPDGPCLLVGECDGGELALELARQLRLRGKDVPLLALIDSFGPGGPGIRPSVPRPAFRIVDGARLLGFHARTVTRLPAGKRREYVQVRLMRAMAKIRKKILGRGSGSAEALRQKAFRRALRRYKPSRYTGRVVLFRGAKLPWGVQPVGDLGWGEVADRLEVAVLPAYFGTNLLEPNVGVVAEELAEVIRASEDQMRAAR